MRTDPETPLQESGVHLHALGSHRKTPNKRSLTPQGAQMFPANSFSSPHLPPSFPPVFLSFIFRVYFAVLAPMTEWLLVWVMDVWFRPVFLCLLAKGERWGCLWWARVAGKQSVPADRTEVLKAREFISKLFKGSRVHESEMDVSCVWLHTSVWQAFLIWMKDCGISWKILFSTEELGRDK